MAAAKRMAATLIVKLGFVRHGGKPAQRIALDHAFPPGSSVLLIGRSGSNDIVLEADLTVSRERHATIERTTGGYFLENRTDHPRRVQVDGEPLARGERRRLTDGAEILIGRAVALGFLDREPAAQSTLGTSGDGKAVADSADGLPIEIVGASRAIRDVVEQARLAARSEIIVLILGETGTGKELVARFIHARSPRRAGPFVAVNAPALARELFESELFGHEKGAFTGAGEAKPGLVEAASGGTLFLDEVGELAPDHQAKLLRVLQTGTFLRVGGTRERKARVRFLAATNRDLKQAVREGRFRQDLFYRLNGFPIFIPPLRERREDVPLLVRHALDLACRREGKSVRLDPDALECLYRHDWPGNVREIESLVHRLVIGARSGVVTAASLPPDARSGGADFLEAFREKWRSRDFASKLTVGEVERAAAAAGGKTALARLLGEKGRSSFYARLKRIEVREGPSERAGKVEADPGAKPKERS